MDSLFQPFQTKVIEHHGITQCVAVRLLHIETDAMVGQDAERGIGSIIGHDTLAHGPSLAFIVTDIHSHLLTALWARQGMKQDVFFITIFYR